MNTGLDDRRVATRSRVHHLFPCINRLFTCFCHALLQQDASLLLLFQIDGVSNNITKQKSRTSSNPIESRASRTWCWHSQCNLGTYPSQLTLKENLDLHIHMDVVLLTVLT